MGKGPRGTDVTAGARAKPAPNGPDDNRRRHWRANVRLTAALLSLSFATAFGVAFFARELDFRFFGWPFSFWVAAQGALLGFVAIIAFYAWRMERLDRRHGLDEPPE